MFCFIVIISVAPVYRNGYTDNTGKRGITHEENRACFRISQEDLRLRGPGDFFGQRQHGLPAMKIADLSCDMRLLDEAQTAARQLMERDPELTDPAHRPLRRRIRQLFDTNADMLN